MNSSLSVELHTLALCATVSQAPVLVLVQITVGRVLRWVFWGGLL